MPSAGSVLLWFAAGFVVCAMFAYPFKCFGLCADESLGFGGAEVFPQNFEN